MQATTQVVLETSMVLYSVKWMNMQLSNLQSKKVQLDRIGKYVTFVILYHISSLFHKITSRVFKQNKSAIILLLESTAICFSLPLNFGVFLLKFSFTELLVLHQTFRKKFFLKIKKGKNILGDLVAL